MLAFLSVLELVRTTEVKLFQRETFGDIIARAQAKTDGKLTKRGRKSANPSRRFDEAALNEEASRELAAMVAEAEQSATAMMRKR